MVLNDMEVEKLWREDGINQMGLDSDPYDVTKPENILKNIDDKTSNVGTGTSAIADTTW